VRRKTVTFTFEQTPLPGVILVTPAVFRDDRGFFEEVYRESAFREGGMADRFVQDSHSRSIKGTLRGLHYQKKPADQAKFVGALSGEIFDVAVDIRKGSPTYGKWYGHVLSEENHCMLYIPCGFAHGYTVLGDVADVVYKVTSEYSPEHDRGIVWNDTDIGIEWPVEDPILSDKDHNLPRLIDADNNFRY